MYVNQNILLLIPKQIKCFGKPLLIISMMIMNHFPLGLFARALEGVDVKQLITNVGSGVGAAPAGGAAPAAAADDKKESKKEEKKEESEEEEDDDMGFGKNLFSILRGTVVQINVCLCKVI